MTRSPCWQKIPTRLRLEQFEQFVWPHLSLGRRGPRPTLALHKIFNYILQALYMGCQWKMLPIDRNAEGRPEIHYTRIYRTFRRSQADGCIDAIFSGSVQQLHQDQLLDLSVIHGDGTTTAAKKGGDNLGYSGHKHLKGDKVVALCDRNCNLIAPFISAPATATNHRCCATRCQASPPWPAPLARACTVQSSAWMASTTAGPTARRSSIAA
ncbi:MULTISPECIES: transposase [Paraburkholderia]|uniref:transposase n=1 Tax=Paraburkholderia TaxID=1822464 RepID=UPI001EF9A2D9|nr:MULTISPECIES: transposase [Paraburkholderia]MDH6148219.1 transposase [Paraburkholderia sp. WSM4179]